MRYQKGKRGLHLSEVLEMCEEEGAFLNGISIDTQYSIRGVNFNKADLAFSDFENTEFYGCNFSECNLTRVNLTNTRIDSCDMTNAVLCGANLSRAHIVSSNLSGADFKRADAFNASFVSCNMENISIDYETKFMAPAPEGDLIGWGKKGVYIVKMRIPSKAKRSWATSYKLRAEFVETLEIWDGDDQVYAISHRAKDMTPLVRYAVGTLTWADQWDPNRWLECSHGIHFFLSREQAETW